MGTMKTLQDRLRKLLGSHRPRRLPRRGAKPRIGSTVVHVAEGVRITMQAGLSDELWKWMMDTGWRVETHRPDRRHYRDVAPSWVTRLIDAPPSQRHDVMTRAIESAQDKSAYAARPPTL